MTFALSTASLAKQVRENLFSDLPNTITTLLLGALLLFALTRGLEWGLLNAVFSTDAEQCRAAQPNGACWGVIAEKYRVILFGRYPFEEQWRPLLSTLLLLGLTIFSAHPRHWRPWLPSVWLAAIVMVAVLMKGGWFGLTSVDTDLWGGLPLTLLITAVAIGAAFPLAVLIALGRRSRVPLLRSLLNWYVELVRGLPLIPVLFIASFLFPLFMPKGVSIDVLLRVLAAITLFAAAYLAEVVRGGIESVPAGQTEAALALGLTRRQAMAEIVLPQALRVSVPSLVNSAIGLFKDTSLVMVVSMFDLTGALSLALAGDAEWRPFHLEGYLFIGAIYWTGCYSMSRYSLWIEQRLRAPV